MSPDAWKDKQYCKEHYTTTDSEKSQKEAQDLMSDVARQYFKQKMCVGRERIKDIALDGCTTDTRK